MPRYHTHSCPRCQTITVHHCSGRNAGAPDCPPCCERLLNSDPDDEFCEDCYADIQEERAAEDRHDAA